MSLARLQGLDRSLPVWIASALALVLLIALPIGWIASLSVSGESGPTFAHYRRVFADPALQKALWNTIVLAFWVGLASIALGVPLAWLTARTDVPGRGVIRGLVMASFVTPPFLGAFVGDARGPERRAPRQALAKRERLRRGPRQTSSPDLSHCEPRRGVGHASHDLEGAYKKSLLDRQRVAHGR